MAESERDLLLVISRLEDFSAKVSNGLDGLDPHGMRDIIRGLVRRIEIDHDSIDSRVPRAAARWPQTTRAWLINRWNWSLATLYRRLYCAMFAVGLTRPTAACLSGAIRHRYCALRVSRCGTH